MSTATFYAGDLVRGRRMTRIEGKSLTGIVLNASDELSVLREDGVVVTVVSEQIELVSRMGREDA